MKFTIGIVLLMAFVVGCASNNITIYKMVDGEPEPIVKVEQGFSGKGCIAVDSDPTTGKASVIVQQAGTSDWSISRLFGFLGDTVGAVFGGSKTMGEMQGPTAGMQGCEGLFDSEEETIEDITTTPEARYLVTPVEE